jgi:hypothetical protein
MQTSKEKCMMGESFRISLLDVRTLGQFGKKELQRQGIVSKYAFVREKLAALAGARVHHLTSSWTSHHFP